MLGVGVEERADQRECGEVDARRDAGPAPRTAETRRSIMSRCAATSTTRWRGPTGVSIDAERMEVEHGVAERHRYLVLGLEANGRRQLLGVAQRGHLEDSQHRALVGHADAHAPADAALVEQLAQGRAQRILIATSPSDTTSPSSAAVAARDRPDRAVDVRLHRRDEAGLDVQADDVPARAVTRAAIDGDLNLGPASRFSPRPLSVPPGGLRGLPGSLSEALGSLSEALGSLIDPPEREQRESLSEAPGSLTEPRESLIERRPRPEDRGFDAAGGNRACATAEG